MLLRLCPLLLLLVAAVGGGRVTKAAAEEFITIVVSEFGAELNKKAFML